MSLTDGIIEFLTKDNQVSNFCAIVGIKEDALEAYLYETISPENLDNFFDDGVVLKYEDVTWGEYMSKRWKEHLPSVLKRREQNNVDSLVAMTLDTDAPQILKDIAHASLKTVDDNPLSVNPMVAGSFIRQITAMSDAKVEDEVKRDPNDVCENCMHCNLRREECDLDVWWSLSKVDITTKYCERFVKKEGGTHA